MSVEQLAERATAVAERLLRQGREDVFVQITRQGRNPSGNLAWALIVKADPYTTVEGLELLADKLEREQLQTSFVGAADA